MDSTTFDAPPMGKQHQRERRIPLTASVPVQARRGQPINALALSAAAAEAIVSLFRQAHAARCSVDWPTIRVAVTVGYRRACVNASAERTG